MTHEENGENGTVAKSFGTDASRAVAGKRYFSARQKTTLIRSGLVCLAILLIFVWHGLQSKQNFLRDEIHRNRGLLLFMQQADQTLKQASHQGKHTGTLPAEIQAWLASSGLAGQAEQLRQRDNNAVQLSFAKVSFDGLISALGRLEEKQGIQITEARITRTPVTGQVNAVLVLSDRD